ncbi:MAG: dockerin type I repeat-containing protein [Ruminococcus sp.]|nr:dockerin type I repeat-containing protein [Ruminococcus sp.]
MNTLTKSFAKRALSILLVTIMVFSLGIVGITSTSAAEVEMAETGASKGDYIYLQASSWSPSGARFAVYVWGTNINAKWINMTDIGNDWYSVKLDNNYTSVIFGRMNGDTTANNWTNCWNQTVDLTLENNCFTINGWGDNNNGNKSTGTWSYHDTTIYLPGLYSNWDRNSTSMMHCEKENIFVKELSLSKGNYTFDVYEGTNKFGLDENKRVYESCSDWKLYTNKTNAFNFYAEGGTYKFTYNMNSDTLGVERISTKTYTSSIYLNHNDAIGSSAWTEETTAFTQEGSVYTYEYKVTGSGDFECGFIIDKNNTNTRGYLKKSVGSAATENDATVSIDGYGENLQLTHPQSGTYTFTLDLAAKTLTVSFAVDSVINFYVRPTSTSVTNDKTAYVTPSLSAINIALSNESYELFSCDDTSKTNYQSLGTVALVNKQLSLPTKDLEAGTYYYYVVAHFTANGEEMSKESEVITVTVTQAEAKTIHLTAVTKVNVIAGNSYTIEVTADSPVLAYELYLDGEKVNTNTNGIFIITTTEADAGKTRTYTVKAHSSSSDVEDGTIDITVNIIDPSSATSTVTVYFKSAVSYGYLPTVKFGDAEAVAMVKSGTIIGENSTSTGEYWWYSASTTVVDGEPLTLSFSSNRYFKECTYTLDITKELPEVTGVYEYYFAIDNLNATKGTVVNLTNADYKNDYVDASNMIVEPVSGALEETSANFRMVSVGDANDDGKLNVRDATIIQKDLANITELSEVGTLVADVNGDGRVTIKDATAIQKQLAGL